MTTMLKRSFTCGLAALALCASSFAQENPADSYAPSDSVMVIVDGILHDKNFKNAPVTPLELALQACPFLSEEDIDEVVLLDGHELSQNSNIIFCAPPKDDLIITTRKESTVHDFILNGKPVHKRRGIGLSNFANREFLLKEIKKKWGIRPKRIASLEIEGKTIRITTK